MSCGSPETSPQDAHGTGYDTERDWLDGSSPQTDGGRTPWDGGVYA